MRVDEITGGRIAHGLRTIAGMFGKGKYSRDFNTLVVDALDEFRRTHKKSFLDYLRDKRVPPEQFDEYHRALAGQYAARRNRWNMRRGDVIVGKHIKGGAMFRPNDGTAPLYNG